LAGEINEANAMPQLQQLYFENPRAFLTALCEKVTIVLTHADGTTASARAGTLLINAAKFLDGRVQTVDAGNSASSSSSADARPINLVSGLMDHIVQVTGGVGKVPKDRCIRAQVCAMLAALVAAAPIHAAAEAKLLELSLDRVPSIREKAVRGLAALQDSPASELALAARAADPCVVVRASAVRGLRVSTGAAGALLERLDDVDQCVRMQLFHRLAEQSPEKLGPAALIRVVAGLADRSASVRSAAKVAVEAWHKHFGGALSLLAHCDVTGDESLSEVACRALVMQFPHEGLDAIRMLLQQTDANRRRRSNTGNSAAIAAEAPAQVALFARLAVAAMSEQERDEVVDVPAVIERTRVILDTKRPHADASLQDFLLRQLLHIAATVDMCDEVVRKQLEQLAETILLRSPVQRRSWDSASSHTTTHTAFDLAVLILRRCHGLVRLRSGQSSVQQSKEARCTCKIILLISDLLDGEGSAMDHMAGEGENDAGSFTRRLSLRLGELNAACDECKQRRADLLAQKKQAILEEEFMRAQEAKEASKKNDAQLKSLETERANVKTERDTVCLRVLGILSSLLRWSNSDLRSDQALLGGLDQILLPMLTLPALEEVEPVALQALGLFCLHDGGVARRHWALLLALLRGLRESPGTGRKAVAAQQARSRAATAARILADCCRLHGSKGTLTRDETLGAADALAVAPFHARLLVLEPLCGWLLQLGHVFFEEHLLEPQLELQWALGWMLVEAFKQRGDVGGDEEDGVDLPAGPSSPEKAKRQQQGKTAQGSKPKGYQPKGHKDAGSATHQLQDPNSGDNEEAEDATSVEAMAAFSRLTQFFTLLPKLPGKHGAALLSLAVESVAESGLWRSAALLPHMVGGQTRWKRGFSWPQLFSFAHERLPEMRLRLWLCSLQLCVASPKIAPLAEVPHVLASVAGEAPAGAADLVQEAIALGADKPSLVNVAARLPPPSGPPPSAGTMTMLLPRDRAEAAERERRSALAALGVQIDEWAPSHIEAPEVVPPHHRMRLGLRRGRAGTGTDTAKGSSEPAASLEKGKVLSQSTESVPTPARAGRTPRAASEAPESEPDSKKRRCRFRSKTSETLDGIQLPLQGA